MVVVSDTSPILNLRRIGRLALLILLYGQVLIPPAVFAELTAKTDGVSAMDLDSISSLIVGTPKDQKRVQELCLILDAGDETAGLRITGLLGVLADAKRSGLIDLVKPVLDDLRQRAGFWIGPDL